MEVSARSEWVVADFLARASKAFRPSSIRMILVADLIEKRPKIHECCDQQLRGCGAGSLCSCCKWCLSLVAGRCEGFYGVRASKALAAYVVLVPFLLIE